MQTVPILFLLFPIIVLNATSQLLGKAAAMHSVAHTAPAVFSIWFFAAAICLGVSFLCWQKALRIKPISFLHPFCSLVYVFVPALSVIFFQENISARYVAGICFIIAGICITSASVRPPDTKSRESAC
jgi:drug/metabolite transporter (DMT)-like permease